MKLVKALTVIGLAWPAFGQYAGPAILSRGEAPAAMAAPQISFRPFLEITGVYDTGLAGVAVVNAQGDLANQASPGIQLAGGISGVHSWKRTRLSLDYRGSLRHYTEQTYYDTINQSLMLGITHQFTRHVTLNLRQTAGMFSQDFGLIGLPQTAGYDPNSTTIPTTDFYDNRTIYSITEADVIIRKSARLSFDFGSDGTLVRRRSAALYGVTGASARGDVQYRWTRRTTVGGMYTYTHYDFTNILGGSDLHLGALTFATALSRWWELSGYAGFARIENRFIQEVPLAPPIQALLGYAIGTQLAYNVSYLPNGQARLSHTFSNGVAYVLGQKIVTPGNGLFLTSSTTSLMAGYNFTGVRRWSFGAIGGYTEAQSLGNVVGRYNAASGGFTASRQITRSVHALAAFSTRRYSSPNFTNYNRTVYDVRIGLGFTPGDIPLRIW